ncbi:MAG TPA: hypothetical protein VF832_10890 [Longimicrobiales bacterium]
MSRNTSFRTFATLVVAGILVPVAGHGQSRPEAMESRAESLLAQRQDLHRGAKLLVQAAALRGETDPVGVSDLLFAAGAFYADGKRTQGRETYVQAAERALAMGDVPRAAIGYVRAALIANEQRDPVRDELIHKANRLAASPFVSETQRQSILGQFEKQPVVIAKKN